MISAVTDIKLKLMFRARFKDDIFKWVA